MAIAARLFFFMGMVGAVIALFKKMAREDPHVGGFFFISKGKFLLPSNPIYNVIKKKYPHNSFFMVFSYEI